MSTIQEMTENSELVKSTVSFDDVTPDEAAKNIENADLYKLAPDEYKNLAPELDKDVNLQKRVPAQLSNQITKFVTEDTQQAAAVKGNESFLDSIERKVSYAWDKSFTLTNNNREIVDLRTKQLSGGLSQDESDYLDYLNEQNAEIIASRPVDMSDTAELGVDVLGGIYDMARSYVDHPELVAGAVAAGAAGGATAGTFIIPGIGTAGGAIAGAKAGLFVGAPTLIGAVDSYRQTKGLTYNTFMTSGTDITSERAERVSTGVALLSGATGGALSYIGGKSNPLIKRLTNPKQLLQIVTKNPKMLANLETIGSIAKGVLTEGSEEALQAYIEKVGEKFGQGGSDSDDLETMLGNLAESVQMNPEELKEIGYEGTVGGLTGGAIRTPIAIASRSGIESNIRNQAELARERGATLEFQNTIKSMHEDFVKAKENGLKDSVKNKFIDKTFNALGVDRTLFLDAEAMREFADTPEKKKALDTLIETQEFNKIAKDAGMDYQVTVNDLFKSGILDNYPEVTEDIKPNAKGETPAQLKKNVEEFVKRQTEAKVKRQELLQKHTAKVRQAEAELESFTQEIEGQEVTPELQTRLAELQTNLEKAKEIDGETEAELATLNQPVQDPQPFEDEFDYLDNVTFHEIPGVLSQAEADKLNQKDMLEVKLAVSESLKTEVEKDFDKLTKKLTAQELKQQVKYYEHNSLVVDSFKQTTTGKRGRVNSEAALNITKNHKKKGYSPSAIDPKSLSEAQKEIYLNNPDLMKKLNKQKTFVEGGVHIEESALMNGVESGDKLLQILATTPSKKEIKSLKEQQRIMIENDIEQANKPLKQDAIDKQFSDRTKIYKAQLDEFRGKSWNMFKRGVMKINRNPVNVKEMQGKAKTIISTTNIRNIKPNAFLHAERRNKVLANKALLEGKPEVAYDFLEKAYLNHELKAEATRVLRKVEKNKEFWKKISTNKVMQATLTKSGHFDAIADLRSLLNLDGKDLTKAAETELVGFNKWVEQQYNQGNYNIVIPNRLDTTSTSIRDITFEQYDSITEAGKNILAVSRKFNKINQKVNTRVTALSKDEQREQVRENAQSHPDYNPDRAHEDYEKDMGLARRTLHKSASILNHTSNIDWTTRHLDAEKKNGFFYNAVTWPLQIAKDNKVEMNSKLMKDLTGVVNKFFGDEKQFLEETSKFIKVPELAKFEGIADKEGNIRLSELMVLQAYRGDGNYHLDIANYRDRDGRKMSVDEMEKILETHLDEKHAAFVQEFFIDPFTKYTDDIVALEKRFNDTDLELVKGRSFVHRGRVMKGGYFPGKRTPMTVAQKARAEQMRNDSKIPTLPGEGDPYDFSKRRSLERTKQSHVKTRTGSERPMILDIGNVFTFHEEITHDLTHREVGKEVIDFVTDDVNAKEMQSILGKGKYETFVKSVQDVISKDSEKPLDGTTGEVMNYIAKGMAKLNSLHAVARIGLSATSVLTQGASLITAAQSLGYMNSALYIGKGVGKAVAGQASALGKSALNSSYGKKLISHRINQALTDVLTFESYIDYAKEINFDIQMEQDGIDDNVVSSFNSSLINASDTKSEMKRKYDNATRKATEAAFAGLQHADNTIRSAVTLAISDMFYAGKIEGYSINDINAMSEAEQKAALKKVVKIETRSTLTASSKLDKTLLEKSVFGKQIVRYWTDQRNVLNVMLSQGRDIRNQWKDGNKRGVISRLATMQVSAMLINAYLDAVNPYEEEDENKLLDNALAIPRVIGAATPFVSMGMWALDNSPWTRPSIPALDISYRIAKGVAALPDALATGEVTGKEAENIIHATLAFANLPGAKAISKIAKDIKSQEASVEDIDVSPNSMIDNSIEIMNDMLNYFIENLSDDYEPVKEEMRKDLETLPKDTTNVEGLINVDTIDNMAFAMSDDNWRKVDPDTGAAGIYQFTEKKWNELMASEPDLGLTESGRFEKDTSEQTRAMEFVLKENALLLINNGYEPSLMNLIGAHEFGDIEYLDILGASDNTKLVKLLGDKANNAPYNKFNTVKDVKDYLKFKST